MKVGGYSAEVHRQQSQTAQTIRQGGERLRTDRAETTAALAKDNPVKAARAAAVDGMFQLYQKNTQVLIGVKQAAVAGAQIDVRV